MVTGLLSVIVVGATLTLVVVVASTVSYYLKDKLRRMSSRDPQPEPCPVCRDARVVWDGGLHCLRPCLGCQRKRRAARH